MFKINSSDNTKRAVIPISGILSLVLSVSLFLLVGFGASSTAIAESGNAVDCADLAMAFNTSAPYEVSCEAASNAQRLSATAKDSTVFVDARQYVSGANRYYPYSDLRTALTDTYGELDVSNWHKGRPVSNWSTSEFKATMRGLPSFCVGFEKMAHPEWGGFGKLLIGLSCSQNNVDKAYDALKLLYLPN